MTSDLKQSAEYIKRQAKAFTPQAVLILGSGLGFLADECKNSISIPYGDIPGFPASTAPGHAGKLVLGQLEGKNVAVMQGRFHYYEGYSLNTVVFGLRVLRMCGAETLFVTNASGGLGDGFKPGDIMLIEDHIKFFDESPLRGENIPELGTRFPDMSYAYTPELRELAQETAAKLNIPLQKGTYMFFPGPQYETPAEIRAAKILGADAVGMSTVPEVIAAAHAGMQVLGFSLVCNMAAGMQKHPLSEQEVLESAQAAREPFSRLIRGCLGAI
ncbi:MAG: purine-nucleoside phosphorylase [Oscillospiraceae bacterium]|nr:purine-nucleoside phosphorylase [Oscillospiraceae bacterium]